MPRNWQNVLVPMALGVMLLAASAPGAWGQSRAALRPPPVAPVRPVTDDYYGTKVVDNYRYFENLKDLEVQQWMKAQADYTQAVLATLPGRERLLARLRELDASERAVTGGVWRFPGDRYVYYKRLASEGVSKVYERTGLAGPERLLVDPGAIALAPANRGKGPSTIEGVALSDDGKYIAVEITPGGDEFNTELHVVATATGAETGDVILRTHGGVGWLPGNDSFVYTRRQDLPADAPPATRVQKERTYLHRLGTDARTDPAVFGYGVNSTVDVDSTRVAHVEVASRYALGFINSGVSPNNELYIAPIDAIAKPGVTWRRVAGLADQVAEATVHGDDLYLLSFKGTSHYQLLRTDARNPDLDFAEVVVPASEAVIQNVNIAADALYLDVLDGGMDRVLRVPFGPRPKAEYLALPPATLAFAEPDLLVTGTLVAVYSSTKAFKIYAYDPRTRRLTDTKLQPQGPHDNPDIQSVDVMARSYDGTMVPLTIVYPKGLKRDGSHAALLTGYGAYGNPEYAVFDPEQLALYGRGVVLATCHARGGGEYGEDWHLAGKGSTKPNTWRDFIACAEYLIAQGYTSPAHLAGEGGSAGGILIGRAIEERPDLFAAAVAEVPAADMLRMETTTTGGPNVAEFGSTRTQPGFRALYAMSAYANVEDGVKYPAVLVTTGVNDSRIAPWEAAKLAARLQAATASSRPVLLRVDYHAGHGLDSSHEQQLELEADTWSFVLWQTGDPDFQPHTP